MEWKENSRSYRLELENGVGRFLLCSVRYGEGKGHRLIFLEGQGLVKGWALLAEKIRVLGIEEIQEKLALRQEVISSGESLEGGSSKTGIVKP